MQRASIRTLRLGSVSTRRAAVLPGPAQRAAQSLLAHG
ncbi:hypothetical protein LUTEI9C_30200 [Luteimonas sp. 9C]|nr:hypothetical protein LUTEI9C_30200 [Luteimonas sp. 9C]